jgi:hypothetical protein
MILLIEDDGSALRIVDDEATIPLRVSLCVNFTLVRNNRRIDDTRTTKTTMMWSFGKPVAYECVEGRGINPSKTINIWYGFPINVRMPLRLPSDDEKPFLST